MHDAPILSPTVGQLAASGCNGALPPEGSRSLCSESCSRTVKGLAGPLQNLLYLFSLIHVFSVSPQQVYVCTFDSVIPLQRDLAHSYRELLQFTFSLGIPPQKGSPHDGNQNPILSLRTTVNTARMSEGKVSNIP